MGVAAEVVGGATGTEVEVVGTLVEGGSPRTGTEVGVFPTLVGTGA